MLACIGKVIAYPVELVGTGNAGIWASFAKDVTTAMNTTHQIAQGYTMINNTRQELKNFSLGNINNMQDAFKSMSAASKLGSSLVNDSSAGINKIDQWTASPKSPTGRLDALNSVLDTAKATLAVSGKQADFLQKEDQDVQQIDTSSSSVSGTTSAVQAGDQLMSHMNAQMQSVNTTLAQQNALDAAEAAQRAAKAKGITNHEQKVAATLMNVGNSKYSAGSVPTGGF
jgi:hypothetical protein|tara:strand:- start:35944 stop:36627 length:684 start_codon:yes stop_codon:yes gene_type:complete